MRGAFALSVLCAAAALSAQTMTGRLAGRVVTADAASAPVRNAIVTLSAPELSAPKSTLTDDGGRFVFGNLPAGRFTITASKVTYVTTAFGAKRPGRPGTAMPLAAGQQIDDLPVRLARAAVITGRVADPLGQPVSSIQVMALQVEPAGGGASALPASGPFVTDDRGVYRIYGLDPGTYVVTVVPRVDAIGEMAVMSRAQIDATFAMLRSRTTRAPGTAPPAPTAPPAAPGFVYAPVYFPGTPVFADAQPIVLAPGEERNADIRFEPLRAGSVDGAITTADGSAPPAVTLSLTPGGPNVSQGPGTRPVLAVPPGADGRFRYTNVAPGAYVLTARTATSAAPATPRFATETITVNGDVSGIALTMATMPLVKGRVAFDGASIPRPPDLSTIRLQLTLPEVVPGRRITGRGGVLGTPTAGVAVLRPDGTFEFGPMVPGTYRLAVLVPGASPGRGWWARSAIVGGKDILDTFITLAPGATEIVQGTLSDRHSELAGTLQTPAGQPATDFFVIVFPTDRLLWKPTMRRLQSTRPGADGVFVFSDLPAGEYFLAALTDVDQEEWQDVAFLGQAVGGAVKVTVDDGQRTIESLQIGR